MKIRTTLKSAIAFTWTIFMIPSAFAQAPLEMKDPVLIGLNGVTFSAPKVCMPPIEKLGDAMLEYGSAAAHSSDTRLRRAFKTISQILAIPTTDPCGPWVHGVYVIRAVHLYSAYTLNNRSAALLNFAFPLYYSGRFVPLTADLRKEWGGEWTRPGHVMGAYDCESTTIYFDPNDRPYDVGAVVAHELEHLVRDKFPYWDHPAAYLGDVPTALLIDETLATLHAGYLQFSFRRDEIRKDDHALSSWNIQFDREGLHENGFRFRLSSDLHLFKKRGHLYHLWRGRVREDGWKRGATFSEFFDAVLYPASQRLAGDQASVHWQGILSAVGHAYFTDAIPSAETAGTVLKRWYELDPKLVTPIGSLQRKLFDDIRAGVPNAQKNFFDRFNSRLERPSPGCQIIRDRILGGFVPGYIGAGLGIPRPAEGGQGTRPGEGGQATRPSRPVTPCLYPKEGI